MTVMESGVRPCASASAILLEHPDPGLSKPSFNVDPFDLETVELAALLIGAMRIAGSTSLAAPQVGRNVRLFCVDVTGRPGSRSCAGLIVLANPEILGASGMSVMREACASVHGLEGDITRPSAVVVSGIVPGTGRNVVIHADALEARCLLHAIDHLDGILFLDRIHPPAVELRRGESRDTCGVAAGSLLQEEPRNGRGR